jgi:tetratricopeptide (TPR) repeat protein
MKHRTVLACALATIVSTPVYGGPDQGAGCKSLDPTVAVPACTDLISSGVPGPHYFDRGMAYSNQYFSDKQATDTDIRACIHDDADAALAACTRVIDNTAEETEVRSTALFHRSKRLNAAGRSLEAMADFQRTLNPFTDKTPNAAEKAIADFTQVIDLDPKNAAAFTQRGNLYLMDGKAAASIADFEQAITLDPKQMAAYFGRAIIRNETDDPVGAVADYKTVLGLDATGDQEKWMQDQAKQRLPTIGAD